MVVDAAPRIPSDISQGAVAAFLAERLEMRDGLFLWRRDFDPNEVKRSVDQRWGKNAWERIKRQAWRLAASKAA
jgi:hypothetical protein